MSSTASPARTNRGRPTFALLALFVGFAMIVAGVLPSGSTERAHVASAANHSVTVPRDNPIAGVMTRESPHGTRLWRSRPQEPRETPRRIEPLSGELGVLREYLLRSAVAAHGGNWVGEATTPDFS
jgi:hypothetical protein